MPVANIPAGVTRLRDPSSTHRGLGPSDFVLAHMRYLVTAEFGGRDTPPDPKKWGIKSKPLAKELREVAQDYINAAQAKVE